MRKDHDGSAALQAAQVLLDPIELRLPQPAHPLKLHHVDQSNEMHTLVVEAVPAIALRSFAVSLQIQLAVVDGSVMFARHIKHLPLRADQDLFQCVELRPASTNG